MVQSHTTRPSTKNSIWFIYKKNITVPTDRLQGVLEHQSYIRKLFGYTSIHFYITSDIDATSGEPSDDNGRIMILPFIAVLKRMRSFGH